MKYIIFDLDDTLLNKKGEITPFTYDTLKRYQKAGHILVINTARSLPYAREYVEGLKPNYSILNGGSLIVDENQEMVYGDLIDEATTDALLKDLYGVVSKEGLSAETTEGMYSWHPETTKQPAKFYDFSKPLTKKCFKILACSLEHDKLNAFADKYNLLYTPYYGGEWGRFTRKGITKWSGVVELVKLTNGDLKDTITFGDDIGDLEMLQKAAIGVAMANSQPSVLKEMEPKTCASYEDGVACFLLKHLPLED